MMRWTVTTEHSISRAIARRDIPAARSFADAGGSQRVLNARPLAKATSFRGQTVAYSTTQTIISKRMASTHSSHGPSGRSSSRSSVQPGGSGWR